MFLRAQSLIIAMCLHMQASFLVAVGLVAPTEQFVTLAFLFTLVYNVIGGWNIDISDPGYVFFEYTPFYHTNHLLRK